MTHPDIAAQIRTLIAEERFDEAETLLPEYARAAIEECVTAADEKNFASARTFLRSMLIQLRARRSHLAQRLSEANQPKPYLMHRRSRHDLDYMG